MSAANIDLVFKMAELMEQQDKNGTSEETVSAPVDLSETTGENTSLSMDDLPDSCLIKILKSIPPENMDDVTIVSTRWEKIIQDNIGVEIWATDIGFRIGLRFFDGLNELDAYTIESLKSRVVDEHYPPLKNSAALFNLEFASQTKAVNFQTLTNQTLNLQDLSFGYSSLILEDLTNVPLELPNLQTLTISDRAFECKDIEGPEILTKNIIGLLNKCFPSIKRLTLCTVATRRVTEKYGIHLLKFLQSNSQTLKYLSVIISTAIQRQPSQDYGSLDHVAVLSAELLNLDWDALSKLRLEELEIDFGLKFFVGLEEWRRILSKQNELVHINLSISKPLPIEVPFPSISLSASSLVTIQLGVELYRPGEPNVAVDCLIFEPCVNLKMLILTGNSLREDRPLSKELFNCSKLPQSIVALGIEHIFIETAEIEKAFLTLIELKKVALENVGTRDEYGMTLPLLSTILLHRQLPQIIIKGVNGDECELHNYDQLVKLGLTFPLEKAVFHVTFFQHFMEYTQAIECQR